MNNLKIAYIYLNSMPIAGVDKKPIQQAEAIKKLGIKDFDIYVLNPSLEKHEEGLFFVKYKTPKPIQIDYLFRQNFWRYKIIEHNVPLDKYDYIILRYPKSDKSGVKFAEKYNLITEHHSNEIAELKLEAKNANQFYIKIFKYLRAFLEKKYRKPMLLFQKGVIGVTNEITKNRSNEIAVNIPNKTISNGISVESISRSSFNKYQGNELNIVFLASYVAPWHGLDRLLKSFELYKGEKKIILHIIGNSKDKKIDNVVYHGLKDQEELSELLPQMHLAIGSLALFRNKLSEASTLKTREYIARGIPFILAYKDTDLIENPPKKQFYLEFPNDDSLIDFEKIISFVRDINEKYEPEELSSYMRFYAEKYLDWTVKMQHYVDFVNEIKKEKAK